MLKKILLTTTIATTLIGASSAVLAENSADKISKLEAQVKMLMGEIQGLKKSQANIDRQVSKKVAKELKNMTPAAVDKSGVKITMKPSPKIQSADGNYAFQPFGRIHTDATIIDDSLNDYADGMNFRRARLGFKGKVEKDWNYKFEMDFGGEGVAIKDMFIEYAGLSDMALKVGHLKPFTGMGQRTSSNYIMFMERSGATNTFTRGERMGVAAYGGNDNMSASFGIFNEDAGNNSGSDDEGWSADARLTYAPIAEKGQVVHLGLAGSYRTPDGSSDAVRLRARPTTGNGARAIDTGTITNVDNTLTYSAEFATIMDSFTFQSEYFRQNVKRNSASDATFDGWYAQASYLLTGETRPYKAKTGLTSRVKPSDPFSLDGGTGAWEIAARYGNTDLNDSGAGITGGEMENISLGLNWYVQNNLRLMANYTMVDTDNNALVANDDPNIISLRAQVDF